MIPSKYYHCPLVCVFVSDQTLPHCSDYKFLGTVLQNINIVYSPTFLIAPSSLDCTYNVYKYAYKSKYYFTYKYFAYKTTIFGAWRVGSVMKNSLLFQGTWVWFPAPVPEGSQPSVTLTPQDQTPSGLLGHLHSHVHLYTQTQNIHINTSKYNL